MQRLIKYGIALIYLFSLLAFVGHGYAANLGAASSDAPLPSGNIDATATPTASKIPIADAGGKLNGWVDASSAPAAVVSFAGTITAASTTATFSSADDYALATVGTKIVSNAQTHYVLRLLGSNQVTLEQSTTWGAGSTITSMQAHIRQEKDASGNVLHFVAPDGVQGWLTSAGVVEVWKDATGKVGIGTTTPNARTEIVSTNAGATTKVLSLSNESSNTNTGVALGFIPTTNDLVMAGITALRTNTTVSGATDMVFFTYGVGGEVDGGAERMRISSSGTIAIGTTDLDGTPSVGRFTVKDGTNDGSTYPLVLRDSDEANVLTVDSNGNLYALADISALTFTDRTKFYEGDALTELKSVKGKDGDIDHTTLPAFAQSVIRRAYEADAEEVSVENAFEDVSVEVEVTEDTVNEKGKTVKQPKVLSAETVQEGFKIEAGQVVPNMVEKKTIEKITKVERRQKKDVRFDKDSGKFFRREVRYEEVPGRDLGAMVSVLTAAVQQLTARVEQLEKK